MTSRARSTQAPSFQTTWRRRGAVLEGGFDELFGPAEAAEDNEFCYRWLRSGGSLRYEPSLVVWHHDWRSPRELERLYVRYARGQGFFYAKHLRRGDLGCCAGLDATSTGPPAVSLQRCSTTRALD